MWLSSFQVCIVCEKHLSALMIKNRFFYVRWLISFFFRHELNQSRTTQVQSQQRYVNELESAKRTFEAQLHQEHESQKNLVVNLQGQVQFHMSRANSLQATIGNFLYNFCNFAIPVATCAKVCCTLVAFLVLLILTIRKVKFLSKNAILTKPQIIFDNFSREIKVVNS